MSNHSLAGVVCWVVLGACVDPHHTTLHHLNPIAVPPQVQVTYTDDRGVPIYADAEGRPVYADGSPVDPARIVPRVQRATAPVILETHHEDHHRHHHH